MPRWQLLLQVLIKEYFSLRTNLAKISLGGLSKLAYCEKNLAHRRSIFFCRFAERPSLVMLPNLPPTSLIIPQAPQIAVHFFTFPPSLEMYLL